MRKPKNNSKLYMGIDLGSTSTDGVVLDDKYEIVTHKVIDTEPNHKTCTDNLLALVFQDLSKIYNEYITLEDIQFCIGTGYGRENIHCAGKVISEISCHAKGVHYYFPSARTVIDMGGQDSKVISIDDGGEIIDFVMNEKCAAGTGRFLEAIGDICEVSLDDMGPISLKAETETVISSMCTVFAESEVISKLAEGEGKESIIKGLHSAIAFRVLAMGKRIGLKTPVAFTGGVAKNSGMLRMLIDKTGFNKRDILVPPHPQIIGALGAAFFALEESKKQRTNNAALNGKSLWTPGKITAEFEKEIPVRNHKKNRKNVVGWTDLAVPIELLSAANINHTRITGDIEKGASSDRYMRTYSCAYIKNVISALLEKSEKYNFLDGVITTNCCNATEKMSDILEYQNNAHTNTHENLFTYPLNIPRLVTDEAIDLMRANIVALKMFLEKKYDTIITEERLRETCKEYNKTKMLVKEYTTLLARNNFPDTARLIGFQVEQLWNLMDTFDDYTADIKHKIGILKEMPPLEKQGPNILLAGGIIPDRKFYDLFSNIKCHIVYNNTSSGNKFSEALVDLDEKDIYRALAKRCLYLGYTPRTMDPVSRMARIKRLVESYAVDGIIFNITKFCVYYTFEAVLLKEYCQQWNIPLLVIESDFTSKGIGQLKTRMEAFIETFKNKGGQYV
ncbi:MAG: 2-hydroxyacyl-CoA dehydratase [Candidatus Aminicenantes bacterium]|nr:MAG: 2-hydroxyacyl-CoA dehydratase [Candidatus Aminicenantes bacterium]